MAAKQQSHEDSLGWTRQKLVELVEAYQHRPCLYDNTSPGYHNREERARSWIEMADLMGKGEDEIRAKMKSIRTQYARIIQKGQHPKCKTGLTVSSWWLLPNLNFLDDFIIPRKADSESIKENDIAELSQLSQVGVGHSYKNDHSSMENGDVADMVYDSMITESNLAQTQNNSLDNPGPSSNQLDDHAPMRESSPYQSPFTRRISPIPISRPTSTNYRYTRLKVRKPLKKLKRDRRDIASPPNAPSNPARPPEVAAGNDNLLLKTILAYAQKTTQDDDEDAIFGRYVGNEMRSVTDLQAKRIAKMRIQKVLFEAQTGWTETSNEGVYHAPQDGSNNQDNFPVGVVCSTNNSRVI
ncbi:uncharacterized protein LOC121410632 [Lytechinus variegatus]|uniref:uncharacterized protein LOC121410632 n=1 Tax=Lytechinus variegatus TaxID=7654 RepID=UPI001BB2CB65|nr:uncharacterized protein LOC121410632 [Lytechinus variegatus]